jgi:hypothetical protein
MRVIQPTKATTPSSTPRAQHHNRPSAHRTYASTLIFSGPRTLFHYYATGITPAMAAAKPGDFELVM